jgi:hypothetical protein
VLATTAVKVIVVATTVVTTSKSFAITHFSITFNFQI